MSKKSVCDFLRRCLEYADASIQRKEARGDDSNIIAEWHAYRNYTQYALEEVEKGDLDYLVFDFLAEVTMSILARAKLKDSDKGFAGDFLTQIEPLLPMIKQKGIKILTNAGGINPISCRTLLEKAAMKRGVDLKVGVVTGDDLIPELPNIEKLGITESDTGNPFPKSCLSINAYLGAPGLVAALDKGADIVITGRCVDSALVLAPLMYEFGWNESDYNLLASGSLAGHIIECGAQCTGGNFTDWKAVSYTHLTLPTNREV